MTIRAPIRARETSIEAFHSSPIVPLRDRVLEVIESFGSFGCITDDVIAMFAKTEKTNTGRITGRFSELEDLGMIIRFGDSRVGISGKKQMIMRAIKFCDPSTLPTVKIRKTGFLAGLLYAVQIVKASDNFVEAKSRLKREVIKIAGRK